MNKLYEIFSLVAGMAAVITITFFLLTTGGCVIIFEPIWQIRMLEILIGFIVTPYYLFRLYKVIKNE